MVRVKALCLIVCLALASAVPLGLVPEKDQGVAVNSENAAPCDDCLLDKIKVPDDFSGDLNELAEQAYAPPASTAHSTYQPETDDDFPQQLKYSMKPGDELIGGQGIHESDDTLNGDDQENLEMSEGISDDPVHEIIHGSSVMNKDIATKEREIESLTQTLTQLKRTAEDLEARSHELDGSAQSEVDDLKAADEAEIKEEEARYRKEIEEIRAKSQDKAVHIRAEEEHIQQRDQQKDDDLTFAQRKELENELQATKERLAAETTKAEMTEQRAEAARHRDHLWRDVDASADGNGLRGRLAQVRKEIQDLRSKVSADDIDAAELMDKLREEQHMKNLLDARLKNLHTREAAVKDKEEAMEATNADLRHRIEDMETQAQADAYAISQNQEIVHRTPEEMMNAQNLLVTEKENSFEREARQAAADEIKRLHEQLETKERLEAHAEQELLKQEQLVQKMDAEADELEQKARYELQKAESEVKAQITAADDDASVIIERAKHASSHIHDVSKQERLADEQSNLQQASAQQEAEESKIEAQERTAKQLTSELRARAETQMKKLDAEWAKKLEDLRANTQSELEKSAQTQIQRIDVEMNKKIEDIGADWMASKIRADKDQEELKAVTAKSAELEKQVKVLKQELEHEKAEWAFQQLAQTQKISFPEDE